MKGIGRLLLTAWLGIAVASASPATAQDAGMQKWTKGKGWGWVWGPQDEVGALNEMTDASRLAALRLVTQGKAYDLGLPLTAAAGEPSAISLGVAPFLVGDIAKALLAGIMLPAAWALVDERR